MPLLACPSSAIGRSRANLSSRGSLWATPAEAGIPLDWRRAPWGRGVERYPLPVALCATLSVLIGSEAGFPHLLLLVPWPHPPSIALRGQACGQDDRGFAFVLGLFEWSSIGGGFCLLPKFR